LLGLHGIRRPTGDVHRVHRVVEELVGVDRDLEVVLDRLPGIGELAIVPQGQHAARCGGLSTQQGVEQCGVLSLRPQGRVTAPFSFVHLVGNVPGRPRWQVGGYHGPPLEQVPQASLVEGPVHRILLVWVEW